MVIVEENKNEIINETFDEANGVETTSTLSFVNNENSDDSSIVDDGGNGGKGGNGANGGNIEDDLTPPSDIEDEFVDDWDDEVFEDDSFDEDDGLDGFELSEGFENESSNDENEVSKNQTEETEESNLSDTVVVKAEAQTVLNEDLLAMEETAESVEHQDKTVENIETLDGWATNDADGNLDALDESYNELENVRDITSDVSSELADLSYLASVKKKDAELSTKDAKDAKKKAQEEKKRKRKEENDIFARRYQAKSINAAVAQSNPIIYFYNAILDKTGEIKLFNVYQVLQDRFVGKLVPQLWTAVAESSDRVLELNMANLVEQMKICEQYPMYEFVLTMSTRFFTKPAVLEKMLALIEKPIPNLVMAFDCVSLQNLGSAAKTGLGQVKAKGVKIILDNTEKVSMTTLSELEFDYLRIDSRYYELGNFKSEGFLRLLSGWANELGIPTIAMYCDHNDMVEYMLYMGIDLVQGNSVSRPMRTVPNAVKAVTLSDSMKSDS